MIHLEDFGPLKGQLDRVRHSYDLGVRTMLPSYNNRNAAGGGCLDEAEEGLTAYGRALIREMNAVGLVADGSNCGAHTRLDICEVSEPPVINSHSRMRSVWNHPHNSTAEQAKACPATDGVIDITVRLPEISSAQVTGRVPSHAPWTRHDHQLC